MLHNYNTKYIQLFIYNYRCTIITLILAKPVSILASIEPYYPPNESTEFRCEVMSNPPPNITWSFLKCPNYPSLEDSIIIYPMVNTILC